MWRYYDDFVTWLETLNETEWLLVLIAFLIAGALCLRGFGSRKSY